MTTSSVTPNSAASAAGAGRGEFEGSDKIDPTRAAAGLARWRRSLAEARGEDPGSLLDRPDRRLTMLRVFGSTRRLADLCLKHPSAAAAALVGPARSGKPPEQQQRRDEHGGLGGDAVAHGSTA